MDKSIISSIISGVITGLMGYFIGMRKNRADAISKEISNLKEIIDSWKEYASDQEKILEKQALEIKKQQKIIDELRFKLEELSQEIKQKKS